MQLSFILALAPIFIAATSAAPLQARDNDGLPKICPGLKTRDGGCIRYVRGFDIAWTFKNLIWNGTWESLYLIADSDLWSRRRRLRVR